MSFHSNIIFTKKKTLEKKKMTTNPDTYGTFGPKHRTRTSKENKKPQHREFQQGDQQHVPIKKQRYAFPGSYKIPPCYAYSNLVKVLPVIERHPVRDDDHISLVYR